ncbi:hypothetical protein IJH23_03390 [Candidatus Saccharibacteria bacterium]|nr:hypothetical protein [Candidatus Saccharibacteria bacterium]
MLERTIYSNCFLVTTSNETPVGFQENGRLKFSVGDRVMVTGDSYRGYICPGITTPGYGKIIEIRRDRTDHHFHIMMDNGQSGYVKEARLTKI